MGEPSSLADAISLHTIDGDSDPAPNFEHVEVDLQSCTSADGDLLAEGDEKEYSEIPAAFREVTTTIITPPVYAPPSWALPKRSRFWSVIDLRLVTLLILWTGLLLHESSVVRASRQLSASDTDAVWHGLLATSMSCGLAYVHGRKRRETRQLLVPYNYHMSIGFAMIGIVCVLVSLPVMQFQAIKTKETTYDGKSPYPQLSCATLASWDQAFANLDGSLPSRIRETEDVLNDIEWDSTDHWMVSDKSNGTLRNLNAMNFNVVGRGKGAGEDCWNGEPCRYEDGVYMPVVPLADSVPVSAVLGSQWKVDSQVLAMALRCELIQVKDDPKLDHAEGNPSLFVDVKDFAGCSTTVTLPGLIYNSRLREKLREGLGQLENGAGKDSGVWKYLNDYRRLLLSKEEVVAYTPSWTRMRPDNADCSQKLAIVGLTSAAISSQAEPKASIVQAAVCKPEFFTASVRLLLSLNRTSLYHDEVPFVSRARPPRFNVVAPYHENFFKGLPKFGIPGFDLPFVPHWGKLEPHSRGRMSELFLQHVSKSAIPGTLWPLSQLREEIGTFVWNRPQPLGTLLMGGRLLRLSFLTKLSTAAGLALHERLEGAEPGGNWTSELAPTHAFAIQEEGISRDLVQARWSFRIFLYAYSLIATVFLIVYLKPESRTTVDGGSMLPWDVTSIAANAALLCHSPVKGWLSQYGTAPLPPKILESMRIGYWHIHELQGKSGWRVDYPQANIPAPRPAPRPPPRPPGGIEEMDDFEVFVHMLLSSVCMLTALVAYLVALFCRRNEPMDIRSQLSRLMDVADVRSTSSNWSIFAERLLPSSVILLSCFIWLPGLANFLRRRQPWVALKVPQPSNKSLTLDYQNVNFPVLQAIKNRHWFIVVVTLGCFFGLMAPVSQATLYRWKADVRQAKTVKGVRHWDWTEKITSPQADIDYFSGDALAVLAGGLLTGRMLPQFSSPEVGMVGLDTRKAANDISRPFASFETSALRASLKCEPTTVEGVLQKRNETKVPPVSIQRYVHDHGGRQTHYERPCSSPSRFSTEDPSTMGDRATNMIECTRWWLDDSATDNRGHAVPRWLVVSSYGVGHWSSQHQDLLLAEPVSVSALYCTPRIEIEQGQATMQLRDNEADIVKYEASNTPTVQLKQDIVTTICRGLNLSNIVLDGHEDGIIADEELIHTEFFVGDMMGYLVYRFACQGRPRCATRKEFSQDISQIFATYVSVLAGRSNVWRVSDPYHPVDLHPLRLKEVLQTDTFSKIFLICFLLFCAGVVAAEVWRYDFYILPTSPERLGGSLQLLCCSSIVTTLENEVEHPELLSLRQLYDKFDSWGHMYKLGRVNVNGRPTPAVDVVAAFDEADEGFERYRDDPEDGR
ncbi:hypothetical protein BKA56DRAFT_732570 [Ilyonectria sp. MPI-CAGE-AT-0026]|nr:hypothetical protein BKA56DRAFT_732570 [Ilyonectria sp. MPI-CAGE-AT-0026]